MQVTALKMPDGMTYPMVASLIGEQIASNPYNPYSMYNQNNKNSVRGSGVAYVGTPTGFESMASGKARYNRNGVPSVVTKNELLNDPIMGQDRSISEEKTEIRSLVKKNRNLYIYNGSPLTIRLEAPFKMAVGTSAGEESSLELQAPKLNSSVTKFPTLQSGQSSTSTSLSPPTQTNSTNKTETRPPQRNNQDSNF